MKKLSDEVNLTGEVEYITMMDLRKNPGDVMDMVQLGKTYIITRAGKPMAVLSKPPGVTMSIAFDYHGNMSYCIKETDDGLRLLPRHG